MAKRAFIIGNLCLCVCLAVAASAQEAGQGGTATRVGQGGGDDLPGRSAQPAPASQLQLPTAGPEADIDMVPVITGLTRLKENPTLDADSMDPAAMKTLLTNLARDIPKITGAMTEAGKGVHGAHIVVHYLAIKETLVRNVVRPQITEHWYVWRDGISEIEFAGKRLYGVGKLHVVSIVGPVSYEPVATTVAALEYKAMVKNRVPINVQNLLAILELAGFARAQADTEPPKIPNSPAFYAGFGTIKSIPETSDISIGAYLRDPDDASKVRRVGSKLDLLNEDRHWWDVSFGFPVSRVENLEYDEKLGIVQPKEVDKAAVLVLANLFLKPVDLNRDGDWAPAVVLGIGLEGKVREHLFAGLTTNLPAIPGLRFTKSGWYQLFRPYAGWQFINSSQPVQNSPPGGAVTEQRTVAKFAFGLNIPVKSSIARLKDKPKTEESAAMDDKKKDDKKPADKK